ncbi:ABC transporter permease [Lysinibacillus sp. 2017]|uniref:ABC transporter permease n=1 Tax=unclassified Lysinibacillus TaxID=2636778 RepID=UPI000D529A4F|nr:MULTISPECIES: ABC transporter permease [unclassified Lysinibacillus]AWE07210.1 ABC transporter permease [Lysinibacillus sp. 2017]TGN34668.1 ABC transporter permease [Lysinibacillus sp. S2017]
MRALIFANRVSKEIIRDPLSLFFGLAFPLILLFLLSAINNSIPVDLFNLASLAPGIAVFGLSFMAVFTAQVVSKDRASSFLTRLYTTPMTSNDFMLGYMMPLLIMSCVQVMVCMFVAVVMGLSFSYTIFLLIAVLVPVAFIYISIGLICGTLFSEKAAVGICGALLTNVSAWVSGIWFDLDLVGGLFRDIAYSLPFVHAVEMSKAALNGEVGDLFPHIWWVLGYTGVLVILSIIVFKEKSREM